MAPILTRGRFVARFAETPDDLRRAQRLRRLAFPGAGTAGADDERDADAHDALCRHVLVEEVATGALVCCLRVLPLARGSEIGHSYSARFYGLSALSAYPGRMLEMGRFCVHPERSDPDILRVAWAATTRIVDAGGVEMLFGCTSFRGTDTERYLDSFALLRERHLAPGRWLPRIKAPRVFPFARRLRLRRPDVTQALSRMPPLLRSYLALGGWVSDHAVVDAELNTLHVFTALEVSAIPPARARLLRAVAAGG